MKPVQINKSWWPIGIVSVFVMFISWIATFIGIAVTNSMDLVSENYYADEIQFQERIDSTKRVLATTGFAMEFDASNDEIMFQLPKEHIGKRVAGNLKLYRPDNVKLDHVVEMDVSAQGRQTVDLGALEKGRWKVETSWTVSNETFYAAKDIVIGKK